MMATLNAFALLWWSLLLPLSRNLDFSWVVDGVGSQGSASSLLLLSVRQSQSAKAFTDSASSLCANWGLVKVIAWAFPEGSEVLWRAGLETGMLPATCAYSGHVFFPLPLPLPLAWENTGWEGRRAMECWRTPGFCEREA